MAFSMSLSSDMLHGAPAVNSGRGCAAARSPSSGGSRGLGAPGPEPRSDGQQPPLGPGAGSASAGGSRLAATAAAPADEALCWAPRGRPPGSSPAGEAGSRGRARRGGPRPGARCTGLAGPPLTPRLARPRGAACAAAAGAGWGAEASQWHPEEGDAAAATPTPAGRESRPARELEEAAARPGPRGRWSREPPRAVPPQVRSARSGPRAAPCSRN